MTFVSESFGKKVFIFSIPLFITRAIRIMYNIGITHHIIPFKLNISMLVKYKRLGSKIFV